MRKAVSLISGGLDSMLATKLLLEQGIHVEGINFYTGFCHSGHTSAVRHKKNRTRPKRNDALWVAEQLGIKLHIVDIVEDYKNIVINPKHGYGQNLNPCLDCKVFMVQRAREWMEQHEFDFIITGEVIGQRPKSQRRETMPIVSERSGANDRLLRPLCAKNLPITYPERMGWVARDKLMDFSGRSRKPQIALAGTFNIDEYAQPAGGCCVLTDKSYSKRLNDLWSAQGEKRYELDDIILLKMGRHLRLRPDLKLIVGREEGENNFLQGYRRSYPSLQAADQQGALVLVDGQYQAEDLPFLAQIAARFSQGRELPQVDVEFLAPGEGSPQHFQVEPLPVTAVDEAWYV